MTAEDPNKTSLCFIREIDNLENSLNDASSGKFIDVQIDNEGNKSLDTEAKNLLTELKNVKIPDKLNNDTNIFYYKV